MIRLTIQHWTLLAILLHHRIQTTFGDCDRPTVDVDKTHDGTKSSYQTGDILNYSCSMGYDYVSGTSTSTCQSSGSWSSFTLTCQLGTCNSLQHPDNGRLIGTDFRVTKAVRFECDPGYARNGPEQIICYANREWSASPPTCEEVFCPALGPFAHGTVSSSNNNAGSEVTITCDQGYIYSGDSNVRTCQNDGTWSGEDGVCGAIDCGHPVIHLGTYRLFGGNTGFAAYAVFTCNEGTVKEGADRSQCNANQQWDPPPPSCNLGCTAPNIANAIVTPSGSVTHGNPVRVDCDSGYNLNGAGQLTCRNGTWDQSLPTCVLAPTDPPTPAPTLAPSEPPVVQTTPGMPTSNEGDLPSSPNTSGQPGITVIRDGTNTPDTTMAPGGPLSKTWEKAVLGTFLTLIGCGIIAAIVFFFKQYQKNKETEAITIGTELRPSENGSSDPEKKNESDTLLHTNITPESKNDPIDAV